jgi:hypothetical protein
MTPYLRCQVGMTSHFHDMDRIYTWPSELVSGWQLSSERTGRSCRSSVFLSPTHACVLSFFTLILFFSTCHSKKKEPWAGGCGIQSSDRLAMRRQQTCPVLCPGAKAVGGMRPLWGLLAVEVGGLHCMTVRSWRVLQPLWGWGTHRRWRCWSLGGMEAGFTELSEFGGCACESAPGLQEAPGWPAQEKHLGWTPSTWCNLG